MIVGGFYFTLLSTAYTVVGVRKVLTSRKGVSEDSTQLQEKSNESSSQPTPQSPPPKPFSDEINNSLRMFTVASGIAAVISKQLGGALATPLSAFFMLGTTLSTFVFGARLPKRFVKIVHPLVTCTTLTWAVAYVFAKIAGSTFRSMLKGYRTNSLSLLSAGAGDVSAAAIYTL